GRGSRYRCSSPLLSTWGGEGQVATSASSGAAGAEKAIRKRYQPRVKQDEANARECAIVSACGVQSGSALPLTKFPETSSFPSLVSSLIASKICRCPVLYCGMAWGHTCTKDASGTRNRVFLRWTARVSRAMDRKSSLLYRKKSFILLPPIMTLKEELLSGESSGKVWSLKMHPRMACSWFEATR